MLPVSGKSEKLGLPVGVFSLSLSSNLPAFSPPVILQKFDIQGAGGRHFLGIGIPNRHENFQDFE